MRIKTDNNRISRREPGDRSEKLNIQVAWIRLTDRTDFAEPTLVTRVLVVADPMSNDRGRALLGFHDWHGLARPASVMLRSNHSDGPRPEVQAGAKTASEEHGLNPRQLLPSSIR